LLEEVIPKHTLIEGVEITQVFSAVGKRTLLINAREIKYENGQKKMLLTMRDVTEQRRLMH